MTTTTSSSTPPLILEATPISQFFSLSPTTTSSLFSLDLLGEGPCYDHRTNMLIWVDILGCSINTFRVPSSSSVSTKTASYRRYLLPNSEAAGFAVPTEENPNILVCGSQHGIFLFDLSMGKIVKRVCQLPEQIISSSSSSEKNKNNSNNDNKQPVRANNKHRFNDGKAFPGGNHSLFAGTLHTKLHSKFTRPLNSGSLYSFSFAKNNNNNNTEIRCLNDSRKNKILLSRNDKKDDDYDDNETENFGVTISNGLAFAHEVKNLYNFYYIDSQINSVHKMIYNSSSKKILKKTRNEIFNSKKPFFGSAAGENKEKGRPDGMCISKNGNLFIALVNGGKVICIDPSTKNDNSDNNATVKAVIKLPSTVENPTSVCFGGENLDILFITTAVATTMDACEKKLKSSSCKSWMEGKIGGQIYCCKIPVQFDTGLKCDFVSVPNVNSFLNSSSKL